MIGVSVREECEGMMNENDYFLTLSTPLPEDIQKLKWCGQFEQARRVIGLRLERELPRAMRDRLRLELEILERMPGQYPYSWEEALEILRREIQDFEDAELTRLWEEDAADWIYVDGKVRFRSSFLSNILKTRPQYGKRAVDPSRISGRKDNLRLLEEAMRRMKESEGMSCSFRIRSTVEIKPEAEREGEPIRVYLPLPIEYSQIRNVKVEGVYVGGREAEPSEYTVAAPLEAQRTICFHTNHRRGQQYAVEYSFENHAPYHDFSRGQALLRAAALAERSEGSQGEIREICRDFCREQLPHIRFTPYLRSLVREVVGEETNPLLKARLIYDYITSHVMYSYVRSYFTLTDIPEYVSTCFKGDCGVQALLFITMCRAAGVPARWQAGLYATPLEIGCHDWAQFYVEPFGWLYADCSFGGAAFREDYQERWEFYFGNLDPYRMPAAREFQADFNPPMAHLRNDPYDNQVGEAEYEDRSLTECEYTTDHRMVKLREW
ncbi:MAG: transglutaminase domain-containing protein [Enterocloster asparagiformis]|nr:transglutaminase domain-containing protein [Enterocloster asparagiformis]